MTRARYGEKTVELHIRFFTDEIATDGIRPKHAWDCGTVSSVVNRSHSITHHIQHFNSMAELPLAVEKVLIKAVSNCIRTGGARI